MQFSNIINIPIETQEYFYSKHRLLKIFSFYSWTYKKVD